jgi:hypothetical protein
MKKGIIFSQPKGVSRSSWRRCMRLLVGGKGRRVRWRLHGLKDGAM